MRFGKAHHDAGEVAHALSLGANQHLAAQQVEGLNTGGALVQGCNARVARDLLHPVLVNVAVAAKYLHAEIGGFQTHFGQKALEDGGVEAESVIVLFPRGGIVFEHRIEQEVGRLGRRIDHGAATFSNGFLRQQHAPHIGVPDQRVSG